MGSLKEFCLDFGLGPMCIITLFHKTGLLRCVRITGEQIIYYRISNTDAGILMELSVG